MKDPRMPDIYAVIPCAGTGSRAGTAIPKQYQPIAGRAMLWHTLAAFAACPAITETLLVLAPGDDWFAQHTAPPEVPARRFMTTPTGGASRAESVRNGLLALREQGAQPDDWVLVHDAARCLITREQIEHLIEVCAQDETGGLLAVPLPDTLKCELPRNGLPADVPARVAATVPRDDKWLAQTPQMFRLGVLLQALESGLQHAPEHITDEASAIERLGLQPLLVQGSGWNFKVTYPEDFTLAEAVLLARQNSARAA